MQQTSDDFVDQNWRELTKKDKCLEGTVALGNDQFISDGGKKGKKRVGDELKLSESLHFPFLYLKVFLGYRIDKIKIGALTI